MEVIKYKPEYHQKVNEIYKKSFPKQERYSTLEKMIKTSNTELYCLVDKDTVIGFTYLIFYDDMIFILYLAINTNNRSNGYGSYLLKWCLDRYKDKIIYLNIEEVKKDSTDYEIRKKRLDFYLKNGFFLTEYLSKEGTIDFNILSNKEQIDINKYKMLDKAIAQILNEPVSTIVKHNCQQ